MIRVKDSQGNIIPGLFKDASGAIVVSDTTEFNKYKRQRDLALEQANQIRDLKTELSDLKQLVQQLLESKRGN